MVQCPELRNVFVACDETLRVLYVSFTEAVRRFMRRRMRSFGVTSNTFISITLHKASASTILHTGHHVFSPVYL